MSNCPLLVLDAGHFEFESNMVSKESRKKNLSTMTTASIDALSDLIYDQFTLSLTSFRVCCYLTSGVYHPIFVSLFRK